MLCFAEGVTRSRMMGCYFLMGIIRLSITPSAKRNTLPFRVAKRRAGDLRFSVAPPFIYSTQGRGAAHLNPGLGKRNSYRVAGGAYLPQWANYTCSLGAHLPHWANYTWSLGAHLPQWANYTWSVGAYLPQWTNYTWSVGADLPHWANYTWSVGASLPHWAILSSRLLHCIRDWRGRPGQTSLHFPHPSGQW